MAGPTLGQALWSVYKKKAKGYFTTIPGEIGQFYKIENYDCMEDFFMTITSASDIWNFCILVNDNLGF